MSLLVLLGLAVAPGLAIAVHVYQRDLHEKEPLHLLVKCFMLGMFSVLPAIALETIGMRFFQYDNYLFHNLIFAFVVVGFSEEFSKYIFLRHYAFNKTDFNEPYDGIIYSVMISLGFATLENILYVLDGGVQTAMMRMFTAVPAHAANGVIMGYFVGLAKFNPAKRTQYLLFGLLSATFFHGLYDFFLFVNKFPFIAGGAFVTLFIVIRLSRKAMRLHSHNSPFKDLEV